MAAIYPPDHMTEPNTAQSIVDGQLAELQITSAEVTGETYKEQHDAKIKALADEEAALPTPTDKATLQAVQDFITKSERARTGIDKWRKAFKDQWNRIIDPVDTYIGTNKESGMQARLFEIQQRAEAKKKAYVDEQAKAQREAECLLEERYTGRVAKLLGAGMEQRADTLVIEHEGQTMSALLSQVRFATDEQMATVVLKVHAIAAQKETAALAAQQAKEAEERERQEEAARLAAQKAEQEAEAAKLKAEREAFEKERAEHAAKMKAEQDQREWDAQILCAAERGQQLAAVGAEQYEDGPWHLGVIEGDPEVTQADLREMTPDEWTPVLARFKEAAEAPKVEPVPNDPDHTVIVSYPDPMEQADFLPVHPQPLQEGSAVDGAQPEPMLSDGEAERLFLATGSVEPRDAALAVRDWYEARIADGTLVRQ